MSYVTSKKSKNQLQNHEYFYSGVTKPFHFHPQCNTKFSILINSIFFSLTFYQMFLRTALISHEFRIVTWNRIFLETWIWDAVWLKSIV